MIQVFIDFKLAVFHYNINPSMFEQKLNSFSELPVKCTVHAISREGPQMH